ncbi:MAG: radical SAM protein [Syntrophaceae bacterium]|nr:radical SAM protein [Syntrophaceae bacterium]
MDKKPNNLKYIFGPVPSRRLGRSLGVDLVPYKTCTFDCIYCDIGKTTCKTTSRQSYVSPEEIKGELELYLSALDKKPDYITLSGSGEPTLNRGIGEIIHHIKELTSIPLAVLTNGSLFSLEEVREALAGSDVVIPSLDAVSEVTFQCLNRPHPSLKIEDIILGLIQFRKEYRGQIWLEVVFCRGVNDDKEEIERLKGVIERIHPDKVQLNTPIRPPAEEFAYPLTTHQLEEIRKQLGAQAEIISEFTAPLGIESNSINEIEILNLIKRRPCTTEDISKALGLHLDEVVKYLGKLVREGRAHYRMHEHHCYYEGTLIH